MNKIVSKGKTAVVNYTGRLDNGQIFDTSEGKNPLKFMVGSNQVIPAFESCILDREIGFKTTIKISAGDAYGHVKQDLFVKVDLDKIPSEAKVGQVLHAVADGQEVSVLVKEINSDHVIIDANHPLAGKDLEFDIEVIDVI